jgi:hypothetical protein
MANKKGDGEDIKDIGNILSKFASSMGPLEKNLDSISKKMTLIAKALAGDEVKEAINNLDGLDKKYGKLNNSLGGLGEALNELTDIEKENAEESGKLGGILSGITDAFTSVTSVVGGVISAFAGFGKIIINVSQFILNIPLKIFDMLEEKAVEAAHRGLEIARAYEEVRKSFGSLTGAIPQSIRAMTNFSTGAKQTGLSAYRVFGDTAERVRAFNEAFVAMGPLAEDFSAEIKKSGDSLLYMQKGLGLSNEQSAKMMQLAKTAGTSLGDLYTDVTKHAMGLAAATGLNQKNLARDISEAMTDVANSSGVATEKIAASVAYVRKLGVAAKDVQGVMSAFKTFDTAAQNSAKLAQSFGLVVDTFQMMKAQTPGEKIEMLRRSMAAAGKDAATMNIQELELLSSSVGLDAATAKQVFSLKNQGMSYDAIMKQAEKDKAKKIDQATATKMLADEIERMNINLQVSKGYFANFFEGMMKGIGQNKEMRKLLNEIGQGFIAVQRVGVQFGREIFNIFPGLKDMLVGLRDILKSENMTAFFKSLSTAIKTLVSSDKPDLIKFFDSIVDSAQKVFNQAGPGAKKMMDGLGAIGTFLSKMLASVIRFAGEMVARGMVLLTDGINTLVNFLKNGPAKKTADEAGKQVGDGFLDQMKSAFSDAGGKLAEAWPNLSKALDSLYENILKPKFLSIIDDIFSFIKTKIGEHPILATLFIGSKVAGVVSSVASAATAITSSLAASLIPGAAALGKSITAALGPIGILLTTGTLAYAGTTAIMDFFGVNPENLVSDAKDYLEEIDKREQNSFDNLLKKEKEKQNKKKADLEIESQMKMYDATRGEILAMKQLGLSLEEIRANQAKEIEKKSKASEQEAIKSLQERFKEDPQKYMGEVSSAAKTLKEAQKEIKTLDEKSMTEVFTKLKNIQDKISELNVDENELKGFASYTNIVELIIKSVAMTAKTLSGFSTKEFFTRFSALNAGFSTLNVSGFETLAASFKSIADQITTNEVVGSIDKVTEVIKKMTELDHLLAEAGGKKAINLQAHLDQFIKKASISSKPNLQSKIPLGARIEMNVTFNVTMDAQKVEAGVLQRPDSVIRSFLITRDATDQTIPKSPNEVMTLPNQSGGQSSAT